MVDDVPFLSKADSASTDSCIGKRAALGPVEDTALLSAWAELRLTSGLAFGINVYGEFGRGFQAVTGRASVRYQW